MSHSRVAFGTILFLTLLSAGIVRADVSKDERNLAREEKRLTDTAAKPGGEKAVVSRLVQEFTATDRQVASLRERKLAYGEIAVVLALAQTMQGGATDGNIQKVLDLRQGPPAAGWKEVSRSVGVKLGKIVSRVRMAANNANRDIKDDHARSGKAPKGVPPEAQHETRPSLPPASTAGEGKSLPQGNSAR